MFGQDQLVSFEPSSLDRQQLAMRPLILILFLGTATAIPKTPLSSISVGPDHFQEIAPDGSYRYAYESENGKEYKVEKRSIDGTVEGETLVVRSDGTPVRVHYTADKKFGYRPRTEVLTSERRVTEVVNLHSPHPREREVHVFREHIPYPRERDVYVVREPAPQVLHPPPAYAPGSEFASFARDSGSNVHISSGPGGGDVAAALPSVTAIVGPGGFADIQPEAYARTGDSHGFRGFGSGGDVAVAKPSATAIVGPGGSVRVRPIAHASTDGGDHGYRVHAPSRPLRVPVPVEVVPPRVHYVPEPPRHYVPEPQRVHYVPEPVPVRVRPVPVPVHIREPVPVHGPVLVVPPNPSYAYTYSYSAPDGKHPQRDNSAFVSVQVNH